ncbi:hypothetical protein Tco_0721828 [Tanacetum coccineum]
MMAPHRSLVGTWDSRYILGVGLDVIGRGRICDGTRYVEALGLYFQQFVYGGWEDISWRRCGGLSFAGNSICSSWHRAGYLVTTQEFVIPIGDVSYVYQYCFALLFMFYLLSSVVTYEDFIWSSCRGKTVLDERSAATKKGGRFLLLSDWNKDVLLLFLVHDMEIERVMDAPIISISSDSSEESVGSRAPRVILFGVIPVIIPVIPKVPIVPAYPLVALDMGKVSVVSPAGVLDLVDYSSSSNYDPSKDSLPPVPDLLLVSPFLCSDDSEADGESEPAEQRPVSSSHESLTPSSEFPLALIVAPPGIRRRSVTLIRPGTNSTTLTAKLPILNPRDYDLWLMRIEQYFLMTDYSLWEVIKNGNKVLKRTVGETEQEYEPTTAEEKQDRRNEMKARGTLLMALPNKDQLKFHSYKDAKLLMEAIEKSQLEIQGEVITQEDMNLKLLRSLPSEWKTHALIWRNKQEIETISLDDLYNNLKIYEPEISGSSSTSQNLQNVAFVSSNSTNSNSNTNEVDNTAYGVSAAHTQSNPTFGDNLSDAMICVFLASQPNSPQLSQEDLE